MDAPTTEADAPSVESYLAPDLPEEYLCETCGVNGVTVVLVWLTTKDAERVCVGCFLQTAMTVAEAMGVERPE